MMSCDRIGYTFGLVMLITLGYIIPETCEAVYKVLHKDYVKVRRFFVMKIILTIYKHIILYIKSFIFK